MWRVKVLFFVYGLAIVCVFGSSHSGSSPSTSSQWGVCCIAGGIPCQRGRETQFGSSVFFSSLGETPSKHGWLCTKQVSFPRIPALEEGTFMDRPHPRNGFPLEFGELGSEVLQRSLVRCRCGWK